MSRSFLTRCLLFPNSAGQLRACGFDPVSCHGHPGNSCLSIEHFITAGFAAPRLRNVGKLLLPATKERVGWYRRAYGLPFA
jgi:hypothetical protein